VISRLLVLLLWLPLSADAQLIRERAQDNRPVELTFPTPRHITLPTTEPLSRGELYYAIQHVFGNVNAGWQDFWGIDNGANVRFTLEYGLTDRFSAFVGRSSTDKIYEMGARWHVMQQTESGSVPLSISVVPTGQILSADHSLLGIDYAFADRLQASLSLPIARKMNERLSVMVVPTGAVFSATNSVMRLASPADDTYAGVGVGARYKFTPHLSVTAQGLPAMRFPSRETDLGVGFGLDWETGGHVFQLYLTNSQGLNEAYALASPFGDPMEGELRFGFTIHRSFALR